MALIKGFDSPLSAAQPFKHRRAGAIELSWVTLVVICLPLGPENEEAARPLGWIGGKEV